MHSQRSVQIHTGQLAETNGSGQIHIPCGVVVTAAMVTNELSIMSLLVCFLKTTIANRIGKGHFAAWILRVM